MKQKRKARRSFGAIRKLQSGKYQASYQDQFGVRYTAPQTFDSYAKADYFLAEKQIEIEKRIHLNPRGGKMTLREWWLDFSSSQDWANSTRAIQELNAKNYLLAQFPNICLADISIREITPYMVNQWWASVQKAAEENTNRIFNAPKNQSRQARKWAFANGIPVEPLGKVKQEVIALWKAAGSPTGSQLVNGRRIGRAGATAAAKAYKLLNQLMIAAVDLELIYRNPCKIKGAGSEDRAERPIYSPEQVLNLALAVPARYYAAVRFAAYSGLRQGEQFALEVRDYDPATKTIHVNKSRVANAKSEIKAPKTSSGIRSIILPAVIAQELEAHISKYTSRKPSDLIFTTEIGTMVTSATLYSWFNPARNRLGLSDHCWHDLRHTALTAAASISRNLKAVQNRAGHASTKASINYLHKTPEADQEIAEGINASLISLEEFRNSRNAS